MFNDFAVNLITVLHTWLRRGSAVNSLLSLRDWIVKLTSGYRDHLKAIGPLIEKGVVTFGGRFSTSKNASLLFPPYQLSIVFR